MATPAPKQSTVNGEQSTVTTVQPAIQTTPSTFSQPAVAPVTTPSTVHGSPFTPLSVPQQIPTVITKSAPRIVVEESTPASQQQSPITKIEMQTTEDKEITSKSVEFSIDAAPPSPPIAINTIVGQVMDQDRKIIEGVILEIKDSSGRPVRALKSNKAGHFIIVTPLSNGKYEVSIEKDGFIFEPVSFEAKGEMIPPMAIKGTKI